MEVTDRMSSSQVVLEGPRDCQASQEPQAPEVPKASEGCQDYQELMDHPDSRVSQEIQVVKGSQGPQGSWGPEDPKAQSACLAQMGSRVPVAHQGQSGFQGTGAFLAKSWEPSPVPGEMLDCLDTPG